MQKQTLKPETLEGLRTVPTGHPVGNFVRIAPSDVVFHLGEGRHVLVLLPNADYGIWCDAPSPKGKHFVFWG